MGMMEFLTPSEIYLKVENALWPILLTNWKVRSPLSPLSFALAWAAADDVSLQVWPFVQAVMFLYVPLVYRVPLSGVVNLVWTIFLSWETAPWRELASLQRALSFIFSSVEASQKSESERASHGGLERFFPEQISLERRKDDDDVRSGGERKDRGLQVNVCEKSLEWMYE